MKKTVPLYWDPQDGTHKIRIGSAVVDDETFEIEATITSNVIGTDGLKRRFAEPMLDISLSAQTKYKANLADLLPPHTVLAPDAKITVADDISRRIYPENHMGD